MARITATEAGRNFSEVLNRVSAGEEIEIVRNGVPVARMSPVKPLGLPWREIQEILDAGPPPDPDWYEEWRELRRSLPPLSDEDPWATS